MSQIWIVSDGDETAPRLPPHPEPVSASGMRRQVIWLSTVVRSGSGGRPLPEQVQKLFPLAPGRRELQMCWGKHVSKALGRLHVVICTRAHFVCGGSCLTSLMNEFITLDRFANKTKVEEFIQKMTFCVILQRGSAFPKDNKIPFHNH